MSNNSFSSIEEAIAALKAGKMIILMDDEDREMKVIYVLLLNLQHLNRLILWLYMAED